MWFSVLPICLLLTYSREVVVLGGGPAGLVRDRARRTVDPEVWTWQLIRESRWRVAGLMEDIPTLLPRSRQVPLAIMDCFGVPLLLV